MSLGVSDKPAPEACWVSLWTERHRCTLDPVHRITGKTSPCSRCKWISNNSMILFHIATNLQSVVAVTNTVNFSLLAKHGLPRGCRSQSQVLLQKQREWNVIYVLLFWYQNEVTVFLCCTQRCVTCCICVYLQTDCLCYFLHQAIIDDAVNNFLPGDGTG